MCLQRVPDNKQKKLRIKHIFVGIFKATDEKSKIRIHKSVVRIPGSGFVGTKMSHIHKTSL
jgi:hypothetical protein